MPNEAEKVFQNLKQVVTSFPVQLDPDCNLPFTINTDASKMKVTHAKRKYAVADKETLTTGPPPLVPGRQALHTGN